ncbi:MAG: hypothetical protein OXC00_11875, partial [Acidimicrobiaceae bacterium]|nr:hypothetical protein [Acidimicrobiaceae bacterium]
PVPAAVAAAVGRAVGVWPTELPLTPPRVWSLLQQAQQQPYPVASSSRPGIGSWGPRSRPKKSGSGFVEQG